MLFSILNEPLHSNNIRIWWVLIRKIVSTRHTVKTKNKQHTNNNNNKQTFSPIESNWKANWKRDTQVNWLVWLANEKTALNHIQYILDARCVVNMYVCEGERETFRIFTTQVMNVLYIQFEVVGSGTGTYVRTHLHSLSLFMYSLLIIIIIHIAF